MPFMRPRNSPCCGAALQQAEMPEMRIDDDKDLTQTARRSTMPGRDRTGPGGEGPMTGRAAGPCAGNAVPASVVAVPGRGFGGQGRGRGGGQGRRHRFYATGLSGRRVGAGGPPFDVSEARPAEPVPPATPEQELGALVAQVEYCQETLAELKKRIAELESGPS